MNGEKKRIPVTFEEIPEGLKNAFIAAEDNRFYSHNGVDYFGLLRAFKSFISTGKVTQGGSTITMQVARNFYLSREKKIIRKLREILLAYKMESNLSKERIFMIVDKPMTKILPELYEENNEIPNVYNNILDNKQKQNSNNFRLKRSQTKQTKSNAITNNFNL